MTQFICAVKNIVFLSESVTNLISAFDFGAKWTQRIIVVPTLVEKSDNMYIRLSPEFANHVVKKTFLMRRRYWEFLGNLV